MATLTRHGLGRNGNPPPRYQRRINTLGPSPSRSVHWRGTYLTALADELRGNRLDMTAYAALSVIASASNSHGKDVYWLTEAEIGASLSVSGATASRALDRARLLGWIEWDHINSDLDPDTDNRRKRLGRAQGPCVYRLLIPADIEAEIQSRKTAKARQTKQRHAAQRPTRTTPASQRQPRPAVYVEPAPTRPTHKQIDHVVAQAIALDCSWEQAERLVTQEHPADTSYALEVLTEAWLRRQQARR